MKTVILTGASGFVGENLTEYFKCANHSVQPLSLRTSLWKKKITHSSDAIVHLAGKAHDTKKTSDESEYFKVNTELTIELFDWYLKSEVKDFFYFSSVKAVADEVEEVLTEDVMGKPVTAYGQSKLKAEEYILTKTLSDEKRVFIIRPCMIHGPGNKGNLNLLYSIVKKGIPWPLAAYSNKRSFLSIDNLNYLIEQMLIKPTIESGVYNFADDDAMSTNELVELIAEASNKKPRLFMINKKIINVLAKAGDKMRLPLNSERLTKLTENYVVSNAKVKRALNINQLPISAKQGLIKTIESFNLNH